MTNFLFKTTFWQFSCWSYWTSFTFTSTRV